MATFLPANTEFKDLPLLDAPQGRFAGLWTHYVPCKACKQHGYYVLQIDAYGPGRHFLGACQNCNGWGWVDPATDCTAETGHHFRPLRSEGRCLTRYQCTHCKAEVLIDSSD